VCNSKEIVEFFDLGDQPLANSLPETANAVEKKYPLSLSWCPVCNLVQLNHTIDPSELFSNYVWVTATSMVAREHARAFCEKALQRKALGKGEYALEIASNDGTFLKPFIERGVDVLGVDPAANIVEMAVADGVPTECGFFGESVAQKVIDTKGKAGIVFARNVMPHVANLHDFVKGMSMCLADDGLLAIEIHYADIICRELHYDSIYHEHLCYFTLKSAETLLKHYGLYVFDIEKSPISGGSVVLYAGKTNSAPSAVLQQYHAKEQESGINSFEVWKQFAEDSFRHKETLLDLLKNYEGHAQIAAYGASARSSTLLNFCNIGHKSIFAVADQNPLKQGRYTAGTNIPILHPDEVLSKNPDCILILAWNFADEIIQILKTKYHYCGTVIIPLPNMPRVQNI
jgi:SAM-dependent methyltransferase